MRALQILPVPGIPHVHAGDDLARLVCAALDAAGLRLETGDVVALAQKVVSKAEGRLVNLASIVPSDRARTLAREVDKNPALVELVLSEAAEVMRVRPGVLIVRHRLGLVLANAGIDQSNIPHEGNAHALLLPVDPDMSAARFAERVHALTGVRIGVLVIDSIGRAWRMGTVGTAIGVHGVPALLDLRGRPDLFGRALQTSETGHADEIAAAASLAMGQGAEGVPAVIVRGLAEPADDARAADLIRPKDKDMFP